jgi:DNA-binding CsgD family transcriptional regulator
MARADYESLLASIDQLYAAALDPGKWSNFLASLATQFQAQNAFVCEVDYRRRNLAYVGLSQAARARVPVQRYETLIGEDPRTDFFRSHRGEPVHCRMATSTERLHSSRVYRDYLKPLGIEYTMVVVLPVREGVTRDLGLTRAAEGRPFDEDDRGLMSRLTPHVERAFTINGAVETKIAEARRRLYSQNADQLLLQKTFELAPAQARLAALLYEGASVKLAAGKLGITEGSARQYLRHIFIKTGTNRQVDLVREIARAIAKS